MRPEFRLVGSVSLSLTRVAEVFPDLETGAPFFPDFEEGVPTDFFLTAFFAFFATTDAT